MAAANESLRLFFIPLRQLQANGIASLNSRSWAGPVECFHLLSYQGLIVEEVANDAQWIARVFAKSDAADKKEERIFHECDISLVNPSLQEPDKVVVDESNSQPPRGTLFCVMGGARKKPDW